MYHCHIKNPVGQMPVLVFFNKRNGLAPVSAMPKIKPTVTVSPALRVSLHRIETIGSSTDPSVPERGPSSSMAFGLLVVRPRPMNSNRSVS